MEPEFKVYQQQVLDNARCMAQTLMERDYKIVSGGTDNHLMLVDLIKQDITGQDAEDCLGRANITVNKNAVPGDPRPPRVTSGLRLGTPAITTRGFGEAETRELTGWMADVLDAVADPERVEAVIAQTRARVVALCERHPVYA